MPQLGFLQVIVAGALAAFVLVIVSMPLGAKLGRRVGVRVLRATLAAYGLLVVASVVRGRAGGETAMLGGDGALQVGAFIAIVLLTAARFAASFLSDLDR